MIELSRVNIEPSSNSARLKSLNLIELFLNDRNSTQKIVELLELDSIKLKYLQLERNIWILYLYVEADDEILQIEGSVFVYLLNI